MIIKCGEKIMIEIDFQSLHPYFQSNKYLACCKYIVNNNTALVYSMVYITPFLKQIFASLYLFEM